MNDMSGAQAIAVLPLIARDSGSQNTEKPYAMPMQRCIQSAAGGTSQRLNPAPAMIRSLASSPTPLPPLPVKTAAASAIFPPFENRLFDLKSNRYWIGGRRFAFPQYR